MFDGLMAGFGLLMQGIWIVPIGVCLGMIVGALPGLGPSNSLAMLLPLLLAMPPELGLVFAVSVYAGGETGNAYPAILMKIPGSAGATVMCIEGYPLTLAGRASEALGITLMASIMGGLLAAIISIIGAPLLAEVALYFSPVEICIVVLFGLTLIGRFSSGGLAKGLFAGALGMLLATIGTDPIYGQFRGTMGSISLIDGFGEVAVLVGLLGFAEMLQVIMSPSERQKVDTRVEVGTRGILTGFAYVLAHPLETLRASSIGLWLGLVPGTGASVAALMAYQQSAAFAPPEEKKLFGRGSRLGLLASGAADNASVGGSLVPLLTIGLPGSPTTAVMLVVMGYHGLAVGPTLFAQNADVAYSVLWSQFAAVFFMIFIGGAFAYVSFRLARVPVRLLVPIIVLLCLIGGFVRYGQIFDMWTVVMFGVIGFVLARQDYPVVALLLGYILGPLFEQSFFQSMKMGLGTPSAFFTRPTALMLWALLIFTLLMPIIQERRRRRRLASSES